MSVDETLKERGDIYGDYNTGVIVRTRIVEAMAHGYEQAHGVGMPHELRSMFYDISNKLCRLAVAPDHIDSWVDLQGYAKLAEEHFRGEQNADK